MKELKVLSIPLKRAHWYILTPSEWLLVILLLAALILSTSNTIEIHRANVRLDIFKKLQIERNH